MGIGETIAVYLGVFLLLWYGVAAYVNRRRGVRTFQWLKPGVQSLGEIAEARWMGSSGSGARLMVPKAKRPFQRLEVIFLLETRELLPLWLLNRLRGKRDTLIFRAQLRSNPAGEVEFLPRGDRRLQALRSELEGESWSLVDAPAIEGFQVAEMGGQIEPWLQACKPLLEELGDAVRRCSISNTAPNVILELHLSGLLETSAENLFRSIQDTFTL
jgi:hypothetical protein